MTGIIRALLENRIAEAPVSSISATDFAPKVEPRTDLRKKDFSSFPDRRDWAQVSKPGLVKRAIDALRRSPIDMDFYFYRLDDTIGNYSQITVFEYLSNKGLTGILTQRKMNLLWDILENVDFHLPDKRNEAATVLFFQHQQADHHLTPWIMAHRIAHAFEDDIWEIVTSSIPRKVHNVVDNIQFLMTMKSAREEKIQNLDEIVHELFTQFLYAGKVTFKREAVNIDQDLIASIPEIEENLNKNFMQLVQTWLGEYVVAF